MSADGSKIIFAGRNQVCQYSTDFGVTWSDVPNLTKGACCSLVGNQMIVVDYDSETKSIEYSTDSGSSWTSSQITLSENFHEVSIGTNQIVLCGEGGKLYSGDGSNWTEKTSGLTDTLNGLVSYDSGFYFLNSAMSGVRTFYSIAFSGGGGGGSSTPIITFQTAPLLKRVSSTITDSN